MSGTYCRDTTQREYKKCRTDFIVFKGTDWVNNMLAKLNELTTELLSVIYFYLLTEEVVSIVMLY